MILLGLRWKKKALPIHRCTAEPSHCTRTYFWCLLQWCHFSSFNRSQCLLITAMLLWMCALFTCVTQFTICSLGRGWKKGWHLKINKLCNSNNAAVCGNSAEDAAQSDFLTSQLFHDSMDSNPEKVHLWSLPWLRIFIEKFNMLLLNAFLKVFTVVAVHK